MGRLFLSYRRQDAVDLVGRIYDRLVDRFGPDAVFRDIDSLETGIDFRRQLEQALDDCAAVVAIIGRRFLEVGARSGTDYVVEEIAGALERGVPILPVLVHDAEMPDTLPERIKSLSFLQQSRIRSDPDFAHDADKLLRVLARYTAGASATTATPTATLVNGPSKGTRYQLDKDRILVGRNPSCDIAINASFASQYHAAFLRMSDGVYCEDLGSGNGTFVNGTRIVDRVRLQNGDLVHVGNCVFEIRLGGHPQTAQNEVPAQGSVPAGPIRRAP